MENSPYHRTRMASFDLSRSCLAFAVSLFASGMHAFAGERTDSPNTVTPDPKIAALWEQDFLTGDWGGLRRTLCQHGLEISAAYFGEVFGVVSGGVKPGAGYDGLVAVALDADFEKLAGWSRPAFYANRSYP